MNDFPRFPPGGVFKINFDEACVPNVCHHAPKFPLGFSFFNKASLFSFAFSDSACCPPRRLTSPRRAGVLHCLEPSSLGLVGVFRVSPCARFLFRAFSRVRTLLKEGFFFPLSAIALLYVHPPPWGFSPPSRKNCEPPMARFFDTISHFGENISPRVITSPTSMPQPFPLATLYNVTLPVERHPFLRFAVPPAIPSRGGIRSSPCPSKRLLFPFKFTPPAPLDSSLSGLSPRNNFFLQPQHHVPSRPNTPG